MAAIRAVSAARVVNKTPYAWTQPENDRKRMLAYEEILRDLQSALNERRAAMTIDSGYETIYEGAMWRCTECGFGFEMDSENVSDDIECPMELLLKRDLEIAELKRKVDGCQMVLDRMKVSLATYEREELEGPLIDVIQLIHDALDDATNGKEGSDDNRMDG